MTGSAAGAARRSSITVESTRGGGRKTERLTGRSVFVSQAICTSTLGMPYSRRLGAERSRSAISRCTMTVQRSTVGSCSIVRRISGVAIE